MQQQPHSKTAAAQAKPIPFPLHQGAYSGWRQAQSRPNPDNCVQVTEENRNSSQVSVQAVDVATQALRQRKGASYNSA